MVRFKFKFLFIILVSCMWICIPISMSLYVCLACLCLSLWWGSIFVMKILQLSQKTCGQAELQLTHEGIFIRCRKYTKSFLLRQILHIAYFHSLAKKFHYSFNVFFAARCLGRIFTCSMFLFLFYTNFVISLELNGGLLSLL